MDSKPWSSSAGYRPPFAAAMVLVIQVVLWDHRARQPVLNYTEHGSQAHPATAPAAPAARTAEPDAGRDPRRVAQRPRQSGAAARPRACGSSAVLVRRRPSLRPTTSRTPLPRGVRPLRLCEQQPAAPVRRCSQRTTSASRDCRILAMGKLSRWPGRCTPGSSRPRYRSPQQSGRAGGLTGVGVEEQRYRGGAVKADGRGCRRRVRHHRSCPPRADEDPARCPRRSRPGDGLTGPHKAGDEDGHRWLSCPWMPGVTQHVDRLIQPTRRHENEVAIKARGNPTGSAPAARAAPRWRSACGRLGIMRGVAVPHSCPRVLCVSSRRTRAGRLDRTRARARRLQRYLACVDRVSRQTAFETFNSDLA